MINFLDDIIDITGYSCKGTKLFPIFQTVKFFIRVIQIAVPFALIIWGSLDWFKALIAHDEKEMRMKRKPFITRVIFALLIFILPWIVELITEAISSKEDSNNYWKCYSEAKPKIDFSGFELDEDSGNLSGKIGDSTDGKDNKSKSSNSGDSNSVVVKNNCGSFHGAKECENGQTTTNDCKWIPVGTDGGYCTQGEKIKRKCTEYGLDKGLSCPSKDDYGKACVETEPNGNSKPGCGYKKDKKKCSDLTTKGISGCSGKKDDYGNKCEWNGSKCIQK